MTKTHRLLQMQSLRPKRPQAYPLWYVEDADGVNCRRCDDICVCSRQRREIFGPGEKLLVGVSGGPDSVFLLNTLSCLQKYFGFKIYIAHVNHCLRGAESDADELFVRNLAFEKAAPFFLCRVNAAKIAKNEKLSLEDAARKARYNFFLNLCRIHKITKIVLAHTKDDQAETVLMRILRGTGLTGLCGMSPVSDRDGVKIIRPLLDIEKKDILNYLKKHIIKSRLDSSNLKTDFFRNRIRLDILPLLEKINPRVKDNLVRLGSNAREADEVLQDLVLKKFPRVVCGQNKNLFRVKRDSFMRLAPVLRTGILRRIIALLEGDLKGIDARHIHIADAFIRAQQTSVKSIDLPKGLLLRKSKNYIVLEKKQLQKKNNNKKKSYLLSLNKRINIPDLGFSFIASSIKKNINLKKHSQNVEYFDRDKLKFPLIIRGREKGDCFYPLGLKGRKKIKDFLIDEKVDAEQKDKIPMLICGKDIVWVTGMRISEKFKVTDKTKNILKITAIPN